MTLIKSFTDLEVWRLAIELTLLVYKLTKNLPLEEKHGVTTQVRRSSGSVGANIAEGFGRYHYKDFNKFLYNSRGSLQETKHWIILSEKLGYIDEESAKEVLEITETLSVKLNNLIRSTINRINSS